MPSGDEPSRVDGEGARPRAGLLLLDGGECSLGWTMERLEEAGLAVLAPTLSSAALAADRVALAEIDAALAREPLAACARLGVMGFGRGGTLAFLAGCTRHLAAVVDVGGAVLHPELSAERPAHPLDLALNFEGAFLGLFDRRGPVLERELEHLRGRLAAAARPVEILLHEGGQGLFDPLRAGYDARRAGELWGRVRAFLEEHLVADAAWGLDT